MVVMKTGRGASFNDVIVEHTHIAKKVSRLFRNHYAIMGVTITVINTDAV